MNADTGTQITLKNALFLTDFSEPSEAALPFALAIAREYGATVHALHVLTPAPFCTTPQSAEGPTEEQEAIAHAEMQKIEARLASLPHTVMIERGIAVWPTIERILDEHSIDLIILGTHGRTGAPKLLGSVAEEIFRLAKVPVLTIGLGARMGARSSARFHAVLLATDFTPDAAAAAPYAVSLAQENQARLIFLHVIQMRRERKQQRLAESSAAEVLHRLGELIAEDTELWCRPETIVDYGNPAEKILEVAKRYGADLMILGISSAASHAGDATRVERATAYKVVAHATCPVLTVRG